MNGIVDVGGGERGIFGAGIFDWCLDHGVTFDYLIGVSAGSANEASFLAGQKGRNYQFYTNYSFRKDYMSFRNMITKGSYIDLEYIYGDALTNSAGENPLNFGAIMDSGKTFRIVATDALTGKPVYFDSHDMVQDDYGAIKASSCVPVASKPYAWRGGLYFDGGLSDPIPFQKALDAGCEKVIIILTRPRHYYRKSDKDQKFAFFMKKWPMSAEALKKRAETYNRELDEAINLERQGKILILAPDSIEGMDTLTKDKQKIIDLYRKGQKEAEKIPAFLNH